VGSAGRTLTEAVEAVAHRDPVMRSLVDRYGPPPPRRPVPASQRFASLATSILHQQLAGRAAATIHARFVAAVGGEVTPDSVLAVSDHELTACGLSRAKAAAVRDLAEKVSSGEVGLGQIGRLADEAVVAHLIRVRGIGTWTAEMFLLGTLGRLDVWPVGDYGVRTGYGRAWQLPGPPTPAELGAMGDRFRPYRSVVAWYCWRVVDD
jgi:DNA-3-methyladenine glycosylase II